MSETIETAPVEPEAPAPVETAAPEPVETATETTDPVEPEPEVAAEPEKPADPPWKDTRIQQLSREKGDLARERDLIRRERDELRAAYEAAKAGLPADAAGLTAAQIDERATQIATEALTARDSATKNEKFVATGRTAFPDFDARCAVVAGAGALDRPAFMDIIRDMDEDGPRVVAHLADNIGDAQRILSMQPLSMALALSKMSTALAVAAAKKPDPPALSKAPRPIAPVGGTTVSAGDIMDDNMSMAEWVKLREKGIKAKAAAR